MYIKNEFLVYDFVHAISEMVDLISPHLNDHHKKTAYLAGHIAREMDLPNDEIQNIVLASMLHDIGAFSVRERLKTLTFELLENETNHHSLLGYKLLKDFQPLAEAAVLIKYHHKDYYPSRRGVPMGSYIIHLADRVSILFDQRCEILEQVPQVIEGITQKQHKFHPDALKAFFRVSKLEYVWMEMFSPSLGAIILKKTGFSKEIIDLETLRSFARIIAQIIDFRNRFTATHSSGVAAVARELSLISGFSENACKLVEIAGLFHDLGKLAVPTTILEKNGKLSDEEYNTIKKHSYYTYAVLNKINGMEDIAAWAAYHHERQDGNGYPFHIKGNNFSRLARVIAVSDVMTALAEDRPYRSGMNREEIEEILFSMAKDGGIDINIAKLVNINFLRVNDARIKAQMEARNEYESFHETENQLFMASA